VRIGLFGGSFDPIHFGHVALARAARSELDLDQVLFLPTAQPPHKPEHEPAPGLARYAMVELALLAEEGLFASPFEWTPGQEAYTVDTVAHFRREWPSARLFLLIGSDSLLDLPSWRRWRELVAAVDLAVAVRSGFAGETLASGLVPELRARVAAGAVHFLTHPPLPFSSSEVRDFLAQGAEPPAGSLPPLVLDYARKYRLYR